MKHLMGERTRFVLNGLVATAVHYSTLVFCMEILKLGSVGASNLLASCVGICSSFLGNRYFVFRQHDESLVRQGLRFAALYGAIALLHGALLYLWGDVMHLNYHLGFVLVVCLQVVLGYLASKYMVFKAYAPAPAHEAPSPVTPR